MEALQYKCAIKVKAVDEVMAADPLGWAWLPQLFAISSNFSISKYVYKFSHIMWSDSFVATTL